MKITKDESRDANAREKRENRGLIEKESVFGKVLHSRDGAADIMIRNNSQRKHPSLI